MRGLALIVGMLLLSVVAWRVGGRISADAVSMAVGVLFGVLAGVPMALMVLASTRRRREEEDEAVTSRVNGHNPYGNSPPVIVVTAGQQPDPNQARLPYYGDANIGQSRRDPLDAQRDFRVVGNTDEWLDDWSEEY